MFATDKLLEMPFDAASMLAPMRDLFSLGLRRQDHELLHLDEGEFATRDLNGQEWRFADAERVSGLVVTLRPRVVQASQIRRCVSTGCCERL